MKSKIMITKDAEELKAKITESVNRYIEVNKTKIDKITGASSVTDAASVISEIVDDIDALFSTYTENLVSLPARITRFTYSEGSISPITLTIRSKLKADVKYVNSMDIAVDDKIIENIANVFFNCLFEMYYLEEANKNVVELNGMISDICEANEIPYKFSFSVNATSSAIVEAISNTEVVFNASISRALEITDLGICQGGNEYANFIHDEAVAKLVETLKTVQTTVQLIKSGNDIIKTITGVSTKKHASKIIRGAYHKNARYLNKQKSGYAYYNETVDINGEEVDVFAIVNKDKNGNIAVVLNPFDTKTLMNVDYDVVKAIKEFA